MVYQDRIDTNISIVSFIILEVKLMLNSSKYWQQGFCFS